MARQSRTCFGCVGDCILIFVVVFGLLCLTHDWSKDREKGPAPETQPASMPAKPPVAPPEPDRPTAQERRQSEQRAREEAEQRHREEVTRARADKEARQRKQREERERIEREKRAQSYLDYAKKLIDRGDVKTAKGRLEEVVRDYADTPQAEEAGSLLKNITKK